MTGLFSGKVALVTAAGAGIGMATAEGFARRGARVMLSDINAETGSATTERLRGDQAAMVPGHVLPADGGWTAQ